MKAVVRSLAAAVLALMIISPAGAQIDTAAREAYLVDAATGTVLLDKNGDRAMPPR